MNILICPDSFKECMSASDVGKHILAGISHVLPDASCRIMPMADGGEGTIDSLLAVLGGRRIHVTVHNPLMKSVRASYGMLENNSTAVIEMASASGLALVKRKHRNPLTTTTFGTGELIKSALDHGSKMIIIGIGGSATVDAGTGMAKALGAEFKDDHGNDTGYGGGELNRIAEINLAQLDPRIKECKIIAACDVSNPLTGKNGAAYVYGPQKGATAEMVRILDHNLRNISSVILKSLQIDVEHKAGAGAAGGLGAGLMAFLNARLEPGFDLIARMVGLESFIQWADLVITGEGRMDNQTTFGKTPSGVGKIANLLNKPVIAFTGFLDNEWDNLRHPEFVTVVPVADKPMTLKQSTADAGRLLENAAERTMRIMIMGRKMS